MDKLLWEEYLNINEYKISEYDRAVMKIINKGENDEKEESIN